MPGTITPKRVAQNEPKYPITYAHFRTSRPASLFIANTSIKTITANAKFMKVFRKDYMPLRVNALQRLVADYDISKASVFRPKQKTAYTMVMKEGEDVITTVNNYMGNILISEQTFKSIRLPYNLSSKVSKVYPGVGHT